MKNSKIIKVLKSLSTDEFKYLGWFVKSDFFNTDKNIIKLYEFLKKHYPDFDSKKMEKVRAFEILFPNTKYSDGKMRNLVSKMNRLLEEYLVQLEIKENQIKKESALLGGLKKRGLLIEYRTKSESIIRRLNELPYRDEEYYHSMNTLYHNLYFHSSILKKDEMDATINEAKINLDMYYQLAKLRIEGEQEARRTFYESSITDSEKKEIEKLLNENIVHSIMKKTLELYKFRKESSYFDIKNIFSKNHTSIRTIEQQFILKHLLSHAIRQLNIKQEKYSLEILELYKLAHQNDLLTRNGRITTTSFLNVITISSKAEEFNWAEQFILENEKKLEPNTREEIKELGMAYLFFYKKEYSKVLDLISKLKFNDVLYETYAKSIVLKAYFELFVPDDSYYDLIYYYSNSFEKYIKRNPQIGKNKSLSIINFIKFVKKIAQLIYTNNLTRKKQENIKQELKLHPSIIERKWLISKIEKK